MLAGSTYAEQTYRYLYAKYNNHYGACGIMSYIHSKNGIDPKVVDEVYKKLLRDEGCPYCTDQSYTDAVDKGYIRRIDFIRPGNKHRYGYGIAQWHDEKDKEALYDIAAKKQVSIGNLEMQLDYLTEDISRNHLQLHNDLLHAKNMEAVVTSVMKRYEGKKEIDDKEKSKRVMYGQLYYILFANIIKSEVEQGGATVETTAQDFSIGDKVIVNGPIYGNGHGDGISLEKKNATMYIVNLVRPDRYPCWIGLSNTDEGACNGWASPSILKKIGRINHTYSKEVLAKDVPKSKLLALKGDYITKVRLHIRGGAGTHRTSLVALPQGQLLSCPEGKYTSYEGTKWLYVETIYKGVRYVGYCSNAYVETLKEYGERKGYL